MTNEQKELLYEIAKWHSDKFYNAMDDHWTEANFRFDDKCIENINRLEAEYKVKYGDLPEWDTIDDVWTTMKELKAELSN